MTDLYNELAELVHQLTETEGKIKETMGRLRLERAHIQSRIDEVAARLVAQRRDQDSSEGGVEQANGKQRDPATMPRLPPRRLKLLHFVADKPGGDLGYFCKKMYGEDNPTARRGLSAEFSHLKTDGIVRTSGRGQFELTDLGKSVARVSK